MIDCTMNYIMFTGLTYIITTRALRKKQHLNKKTQRLQIGTKRHCSYESSNCIHHF